jgi:hypothetical protein
MPEKKKTASPGQETAASKQNNIQPHSNPNSENGGNGASPAPFDPAKASAAADNLFDALATIPELRAKVKADYERHLNDQLRQPEPELEAQPEAPANDAPDLPEGAQLPDRLTKDIESAGAWWTDYVDFAGKAAPMTPSEYHQAVGLALMSAAVAGRVATTHGTSKFYTNVNMLNIGPSTLVKKTTGNNLGNRVLAEAGLMHLKLSESVTPEGMVDEMTGENPVNFNELDEEAQEILKAGKLFAAQKLWVIDEASSLLNSFERENMAPLREFILRLYDCPPRREFRTRGGGLKIVRRPCLTIMATSTYAAMRKHLKNPMYWTDGLWARFALVTPSTPPTEYIFLPDQIHSVPVEITGTLSALANKLPKPDGDKPCLEAELEDGVKARWAAYGKALEFDLIKAGRVPERFQSSYGRLKDLAIKTALLLATADWAGRNSRLEAPRVTHRHYARGQMFAESCRLSLHRLMEIIERPTNEGEYAKILRYLPATVGVTLREINQRSGIPYEILTLALPNMVRCGLAVEVKRKAKSGPPADAYIRGD